MGPGKLVPEEPWTTALVKAAGQRVDVFEIDEERRAKSATKLGARAGGHGRQPVFEQNSVGDPECRPLLLVPTKPLLQDLFHESVDRFD